MKWLFLLLLAANVIFFFWNWSGADDADERFRQEPASSVKGNRLLLLSEIESPVVKKPPPEEQQPVAPEAGSCYVLGPFVSSTEVARAATLAASSSVIERRWSKIRESAGYWVYIPATGGREGVRNILRGLDAVGITDARPGSSEKIKHAVSLGVFPTMGKARARMLEVKKHGFEVVINRAKIRKRQYWLALRGDKREPLSAAMLDNLVRNTRQATVESRPCASRVQ